MLEHLKIFGLIINLIVGSTISLYIFQVYRNNKHSYLKSLGYYTLSFNLAYLILFFYGYLSINLSGEVIIKTFLGEFFISVFLLSILLFIYKIYLGFNNKKISKTARWIFLILFGFISVSYITRLFFSNESNFFWLDFLFKYVFENLLLLEIVVLITILKGKSKSDPLLYIKRSFGILYLLRYVAFLILFIYIVSVGFSETVKAILGFSFLLILNLLPVVWIKFYFIPFKRRVNISSDTISLESFCKQFGISQREKEILELVVTGKSNKEISEILFISYSTVKNHIYNVFLKLNVNSRFELISRINSYK